MNYFETGKFPDFFPRDDELRKGRSPREGYARGWGLEHGGLGAQIEADPIYQECWRLAEGRTIQTAQCRLNLYLLVRYFLPKMGGGSIIEFGSYRGGSAIFLAALCNRLGLDVKVFGLDTFDGMPVTDKTIDAHYVGQFKDTNLTELREYVARCGLNERLEFVVGRFEDTAPEVLARSGAVILAHIDCDILSAAAYSYDAVKSRMTPGGYIVFDDAHTSGCLGATEAVEDLVIRRDGLNCEQIWPHFVFRVWPSKHDQVETDQTSERALLEYRFKLQRLEGELAFASNNSARLQQRHDRNLIDLGETKARLEQTLLRLEDIEKARADLDRAHWRLHEMHDQCLADLGEIRALLEQTQHRLADVEAARGDLNRAHSTLKRQVSMANTSRWLRLGRLFGVGPGFDIPE